MFSLYCKRLPAGGLLLEHAACGDGQQEHIIEKEALLLDDRLVFKSPSPAMKSTESIEAKTSLHGGNKQQLVVQSLL